MGRLLTLPSEQLLHITAYLSATDQASLALVHPILTPIAQDHLFRSVDIPSSAHSPKGFIVSMVATLLKKPRLGKLVKSLRVTVTDHPLSEANCKNIQKIGWNVSALKSACMKIQQALLPSDMREPFAVEGVWVRGEGDSVRGRHELDSELFNPLIQRPGREDFFGGILLSLLPNLETLDIKVLDCALKDKPYVDRGLSHPTKNKIATMPYVVNRLFGWKTEAIWLRRTLSGSGALELVTSLDHITCFNNITKLSLCKRNYLLLQYGTFPKLRIVEDTLPHGFDWEEYHATKPFPLEDARGMACSRSIPRLPGYPTRKFPQVESLWYRYDALCWSPRRPEPIKQFVACFPLCKRLRVDVAIRVEHWVMLLRSQDPGRLVSYADICLQVGILRDVLETLVFSDWNLEAPRLRYSFNHMNQAELAARGIDRYRRVSMGFMPLYKDLLPFVKLRHLVIPYCALVEAPNHDGDHQFLESIPHQLETLEVIFPYPQFTKLLSELANTGDRFPNLKTIVSYHGKPENFNPQMDHTLSAEDPVWARLRAAGIEYMIRSYEDLDFDAERPVQIERMRKLSH